jgi:hypothetical protein
MDFCVVFCTLMFSQEHIWGEGRVRENGEGRSLVEKQQTTSKKKGDTRLFNYIYRYQSIGHFLLKLTINVPVVHMLARDVMILMQENPFRGP